MRLLNSKRKTLEHFIENYLKRYGADGKLVNYFFYDLSNKGEIVDWGPIDVKERHTDVRFINNHYLIQIVRIHINPVSLDVTFIEWL